MLERIQNKFTLGQVLMTPGAEAALSPELTLILIRRHVEGDWGDLCNEDKNTNELSLRHGGRLFSAYHNEEGVKIWLITDASRLHTTFLLPEEY